jgi:hypothetical protein
MEMENPLAQQVEQLAARLAEVEEELAALKARGTGDFAPPFRVVDEAGRVLLDVVTDGENTQFRLWGVTGRPALAINAAAEGTILAIFDSHGQSVATLSTGEMGGLIGLYSSAGMPGMALSVTSDGGTATLFDREQHRVVILGSDSELESGFLRLLNRDGEEIFRQP